MSGDYQNYFINCSEFTLPCQNTYATHKHCRLCEKSFDTQHKCRRHFKEAHLSRVVVVNGQSCFPCKLSHGESGCGRAHYHCPNCEKKIINRNRFAKHYESHLKPRKCDVQMPSSVVPVRLEGKEISTETEPQVEEPKPKRQKSERKECPTCKKEMDVRSLPRHQRDIHKEIIPSNVCVDKTRGIYIWCARVHMEVLVIQFTFRNVFGLKTKKGARKIPFVRTTVAEIIWKLPGEVV